MRIYLIIIILIFLGFEVNAQSADSLFAVRKGSSWAVKYTVKSRETAHMLAQRFYITDQALEFANEFEVIKKLGTGSLINIPVQKENYFTYKQSLDNENLRPLYYHVGPKDDIGIISTYASVTKTDMRKWNNLKGNTLVADQVLFVGWVKVMALDSMYPASFSAYPAPRKQAVVGDTARASVPGPLDTVYNRQTNNGMYVLTEKGSAVFFEKPGKNNIYVAFHNATPRGAIIKVFNPANGKTIYVKVLGPLPGTKMYANSIIGICTAAKEALGVTDNKAWCELSYSPN